MRLDQTLKAFFGVLGIAIVSPFGTPDSTAHAEDNLSVEILEGPVPPRWLIGTSVAVPQIASMRAGLSFDPSSSFPRAELGFGSVGLTVGKVQLRTTTLETSGRWDLGSGPWFVSGSLGYRYLSVSSDLSGYSFNDEKLVDRATVWWSCLYVAPRIGIRALLGNHWEIASQLGFQLPIFFFGGLAMTAGADGRDLPASTFNVENANFISRIAQYVLPEWKILEISYFF